MFKTMFNDLKECFNEQLGVDSYMSAFDVMQTAFDDSEVPANPKFTFMGDEYELPIFDLWIEYRESVFSFVRGFIYPLVLFYFIDNIYYLLRGGRILNVGMKEFAAATSPPEKKSSKK